MQGRRVARVMLRERKKRGAKEPRKLGAQSPAREEPVVPLPAAEPKSGSPTPTAGPQAAIPLQKVSGRRE
jgi:hypothetical protein